MLPLLLSLLLATLAILLTTYILPLVRSPLKNYPGPLLAKLTDWYRVYHALDAHTLQLRLHQKYGPIVRYGPNCLSLSDPKLVKTIYSSRGNFLKSDFYAVNDIIQSGHRIQNIFSTRSNEYHRKYVRPIAKIYSLNNILTLEPLADKTTGTFCRRLEEEFVDRPGKVCDLVQWMMFYAWDVVGEVTFDQPMGFLEKGADVDGMLRTADEALDYFGTIGNMPPLDSWLAKNPYYRLGGPSIDWAGAYAAQRMIQRYQALGADKAKDPTASKSQNDFLDFFIALKTSDPAVVDDNIVVGYMLINLLAGADTTAITLRAIFYYLLRNPSAYRNLTSELDAANLKEPIAYKQTEALPYFNAVVKEAMRLHPGIGVLLERVVPDTGLALPTGEQVPPGTIVGVNPWVIHRDAATFGPDADVFRPERWLQGAGESAEAFEARSKAMRDADLTFGAGNRVCIGRWLALMEVYKIVPTLLRRYKFEATEPEREWKVRSAWFMVQDKLDVKITSR